MGYDLRRFSSCVDEELLCAICTNVLEDPVQTPCQHVFCRSCIKEWLKKQRECPNDRLSLCENDLKPPPFILKNILNKLEIACKYNTHGCKDKVQLHDLKKHEKSCIYQYYKHEKKDEDEQRKDKKSNDTGYYITIKYLESLINSQNNRICKLENDLMKGLNRLEEILERQNKRILSIESVRKLSLFSK